MSNQRPTSPTDRIPLTLMNDLVDMRNWWKRTHAFGGPTAPPHGTLQHTIVMVGNDTATALERGEVLALDETLTGSDYWAYTWPSRLKGVKPTLGNVDIAVLLEPCPAKSGTTIAMASAQLSGLCMVKVNVGAKWHRRARPVADSHVLTSGLFGPCEMLSELSTTGEQLVLCSVGHSDNRGYFAKTTSDITAATLTSGRLTLGSGTVTIHDPYTTATQYANVPSHTVTVYNMAGATVAYNTFVFLQPSDDWLPVVTIEPCTAPE